MQWAATRRMIRCRLILVLIFNHEKKPSGTDEPTSGYTETIEKCAKIESVLNWLRSFMYTLHSWQSRANSSRNNSWKKGNIVLLSSQNGIYYYLTLRWVCTFTRRKKKNDLCFDTSVSFSHTMLCLVSSFYSPLVRLPSSMRPNVCINATIFPECFWCQATKTFPDRNNTMRLEWNSRQPMEEWVSKRTTTREK